MSDRVRAAAVVALLCACGDHQRPATKAGSLSLSSLLGGTDNRGFEIADRPRTFAFPGDHGPHAGFRSEWWYVTGTLHSTSDPARRFGYQFTIFRQALAAKNVARGSAWATRHVYMGHLALTDPTGRRFVSAQRLSREGNQLAGAESDPLHVWVEDWHMHGRGTPFPLSLVAQSNDEGQPRVALSLSLEHGRGPVLQGDRGWLRKGDEPGAASHYYSETRMPTAGQIEIDGRSFEVAGSSWLDREWSTSGLSTGVAGWDWLALQLSDGRDLMLYRLRDHAGGSTPYSLATVIDHSGNTQRFGADAHNFVPLGTWQSPRSGVRYPAGFDVKIPGAGLDVTVRPWLPDQELNLSVRYWEGAVTAHSAGADVGEGYLEMTGYPPP